MRLHKPSLVLVLLFFFSASLSSQDAPVGSARSYFLKGQSYLDDSKLGKKGVLYNAVDNFLLALEQNPRYSQAMLALADTYYQLQEYEKALDFLQQAEQFGQSGSHVDVLTGNIFLALGALDRADASFSSALNKNSNALDAYIGKAELVLYHGETEEALQYYRQVLQRDPDNRKVLLSLAIINSILFRFQDADIAIEQALRYHNNSPIVHETAAAYYLSRNDYERAVFHAKTAFSNGGSGKALSILADISVKTGNLEAAGDYTNQLIALDPQNFDAWYQRGYIARLAGEVDTAVNSLMRALQIRTQNELARIALERLYTTELDFSDERRTMLAMDYLKAGQQFYRNHQLDDALNVYRRGLRIDPYSIPLRKALSELYNVRKEYGRYLQELQVISTILEESDRGINDRIETFGHTLANSVPFRWGINQFSIQRPRYRIKILYYERMNLSSDYPGMQELISWYAKELLQSHESLEVVSEAAAITSFSDAIRMAHDENLHYFLILEPQYTVRTFFSAGTLYTATGSEQSSGSSLQSGVSMIRHAIESLLDTVLANIPVRGSIIERNANNVLFSLGTYDGIVPGDELLILEQGAFVLKSDPPGFSFREEELVGTIQVSAVDVLISEGAFTSVNPVDRLQQKDEVVFITSEEQEQTMKPYSFSLPQPVFTLIRSLP